MAILFELMSITLVLVTKPFSLCNQACLFGLRTAFIVTQTFIELVKAAVRFQANIVWSIMIWAFAFVCLPLRVLSAVHRERQMQQNLYEMQYELENLIWDREKLEEHLQTAIQESRMMEMMLAELEDEQDRSVVKFNELQSELQNLKEENFRLKEIQGNFRDQDIGIKKMMQVAESCGVSCGIPSLKSSYHGSGITLQDLVIQKDGWNSGNQHKNELACIVRTGLKATAVVQPKALEEATCRNLIMKNILDQRRRAALSRSFFSAGLSLVVGGIIWEAKDPCMPLVMALFAVVGMSMLSVVQFFSTIENRPASDAVALLSFNWFILGTLAYPTLPKFARVFAALTLSLVTGK